MTRPDTFIALDPVTNADPLAAVSCAEVLRRREKPVALFTPALLFTHCGFDRDPVVEFDAYMPAPSADLRPFCVDLMHDNGRFFHGLGVMPAPGKTRAVNWDKRLYAIDATREEECFGFLNGIAYSDPKTGFFASTFSYTLVVPDPTSRVRETLSVRVFGVIGNTFVAYLRAAPTGTPTAQFVRTPDPQRVLNSLTGGDVNSSFTGEDPLLLRDANG